MNFIKKLKGLFKSHLTQEFTSKNNYIENKNEAINKICVNLSIYSCSADKNLAVLKLWIVTKDSEPEVAWADANFVKELKIRLRQERVNAIKEIKIEQVSLLEMQEILAKHKSDDIKPIMEGQLYYMTSSLPRDTNRDPKDVRGAWLICIGGEDNLEERIFALSPERKVWNIGRSARPSVTETNDIIIKDQCLEISRQHAAIIVDEEDHNYYVKCKKGGCRTRGGRLTRIIRQNGTQEDLVSYHHRALQPLHDGDVIELSKKVSLQFTYIKPQTEDIDIEIINEPI